MKPEATVVGASIAGCVCARELATGGVETLVLEEHSKPGKFGKCTAIVSKRGLDLTGVRYKKTILNQVSGADFWAGSNCFSVRSPRTQAMVLNRQAFDEQAAAQAVDAGAEIKFNKRVASLDYASKVILGADGAASAVARLAHFPEIPSNKFVLGWEAEYSKASVSDSAKVDIFLEPDFKGFFGWMVPCGENSARIGFATSDFASINKGKKRLAQLPRVKETIEAKSKAMRVFTAVIPLAVRKRTQKDNVLLVGDAAGQVKATTGGGIVFGSLCAKTAAECVARHLHEETPLDYENNWRARYGTTLGLHSLLREAINATPNSLLKIKLAAASALGLGKLVERFADMDFVLKP
ncbi:MAG: NAD(P)/FAD-dependent oxidoreductase [Candidatus Micrarchaeota archaeon]